jgi:hypothetical protein
MSQTFSGVLDRPRPLVDLGAHDGIIGIRIDHGHPSPRFLLFHILAHSDHHGPMFALKHASTRSTSRLGERLQMALHSLP